jgi:hypothetical protein
MAVTAFLYAPIFLAAFNKEIDIVGGTDNVFVGLTTSTYTPNQDTHNYYNDITNELTTTGGYTAGGQQLVSDDFTQTNNVLKWDSTDPSWTSASFTARRAFYYVDTAGASSTDALISWVDFGADETVASGTFTIVQHASGIFTVTATDATGFP